MTVEPLQRHDLLRVDPRGWQRMLALRSDLAQLPHVAAWARHGWPVIARRPLCGETPTRIAAAISLPSPARNRGLALQLERADVIGRAAPLDVRAAQAAAPASWRATLAALAAIAEQLDTQAHVFGSLLWQTLTGLRYVRADSDLDLMWRVTHAAQARALAAAIAAAAAASPMRIDGELLLPDGAAVHWREFRQAPRRVLVKTLRAVESRAFECLFAAAE